MNSDPEGIRLEQTQLRCPKCDGLIPSNEEQRLIEARAMYGHEPTAEEFENFT